MMRCREKTGSDLVLQPKDGNRIGGSGATAAAFDVHKAAAMLPQI
jgi:hypothetical protein